MITAPFLIECPNQCRALFQSEYWNSFSNVP